MKNLGLGIGLAPPRNSESAKGVATMAPMTASGALNRWDILTGAVTMSRATASGTARSALQLTGAVSMHAATASGAARNSLQLTGAVTMTKATSSGALTNFDPSKITGVLAWYRADLGTTIGTGVSQWNDQSGAGDSNRNLVQATGSKQPTLTSSDSHYNNQATLTFASASSQLLTSSGSWSVAPSQPVSIFAVGEFGAVNQYMWDGQSNNIFGFVTVSSNRIEATMSSNLVSAANTYTPAANAVGMFGAVYNGASNSKLYYNSSTALAGTTGSGGTGSGTKLTVGSAGAGANFLNGKVAEIVVVGQTITAGNLSSLVAYFAKRYNQSWT